MLNEKVILAMEHVIKLASTAFTELSMYAFNIACMFVAYIRAFYQMLYSNKSIVVITPNGL